MLANSIFPMGHSVNDILTKVLKAKKQEPCCKWDFEGLSLCIGFHGPKLWETEDKIQSKYKSF